MYGGMTLIAERDVTELHQRGHKRISISSRPTTRPPKATRK
jgi:hypothetical protein